jgi:molybdopterin adenylyltransferase
VRRAAVITVSNRAAAGVYDDEAGPAVVEQLRAAGFEVAPPVVVPDGVDTVTPALLDACGRADLVITSGGTGVHPNDRTPDATLGVVDRTVPGLAEAMRGASLAVTPMAALSRAVAGVRGRTLIVNLPGSPKAAVENLAAIIAIIPHALDQLHGGDHT